MSANTRTLRESIKQAIDLSTLVGEHILTGCDIETKQMLDWGETHISSGVIRFILDGVVYEAIENPEDGYRSSLEGLHLADEQHQCVAHTFEPLRVVGSHRTKGRYNSTDDVLELRRVDNGTLVIEVGTEDTDDYYPGCVMRFERHG